MAWGERDFHELEKFRQQIELMNENLEMVAGLLKQQPTARQIYKAQVLSGLMSNHEHSKTLRPENLAQIAAEIAEEAVLEDITSMEPARVRTETESGNVK